MTQQFKAASRTSQEVDRGRGSCRRGHRLRSFSHGLMITVGFSVSITSSRRRDNGSDDGSRRRRSRCNGSGRWWQLW